MIKQTNKITGKLNASVIHEYPELENIEITPTVENQVYKSNMYGFDEVKVKGVQAYIDEDIKPEYIKDGVDVLGVVGNYKGVDSSDATATPEDILAGKTAYVNNEKIEGTIQEYDGSFEGNTTESIKITDASYLFYGGARIEYLDEFLKLCTNVTKMLGMFQLCSTITDLDMDSIDMSNVVDLQNMFYGCDYIKNLKCFKNLGKGYTKKTNNNSYYSVSLNYCPRLTHESLMNVINNLYDLNLTYDVANGGTLYRQILRLGSTNLAKLTADEIAIATNKGWDVI